MILAKEKWQARTIAVLERVFDERCRQMALHGTAMDALSDGTGPDVQWLRPWSRAAASFTEQGFRQDYGWESRAGRLTRMHLVREEIAEAFELAGDDPEFVTEILQVAALCVQWAEIKLAEVESCADRLPSTPG